MQISIKQANLQEMQIAPLVPAKDQLALLVRYVDMKGNIHEDFLRFKDAPDETGKTIAELIIVSKLKVYGLDLSLLRGQTYYRCTAMK